MIRFIVLACLSLLTPGLRAADLPAMAVDWPAFLSRQDLVWDRLPREFDRGAFLGNGVLGTMIYKEGDSGLRFEIGRSDVTDHRRDNARLPIGGLLLTTVGKIQSGSMRLDLWNAEVKGTVNTDKGSLKFTALIPYNETLVVIDLEPQGEETQATFSWKPGSGQDGLVIDHFKDPRNPDVRTETIDGIPVSIQERKAGGEFATAWLQLPAGDMNRRVFLSVADSFPGNSARKDAVATIQKATAADFGKMMNDHRQSWHSIYPRSFVSIPDPQLESFYWIQIYKLASASRPDGVPVDLLGPWFRPTWWPRIWWNLNIQTLYLSAYAANQLELGESFVNFIDKKRANFVRNARDLWKIEDGATVPHTTCYEGLRGDGLHAPDKYINPGDFTWALHNYWLHYRHSMDHSMITDQSKHAFYPMLRGTVNVYLSLLKKESDGKLHLPKLQSPEYGEAEDNNYNLSLLRWACQTVIDLNKRYSLNDPLAQKCQETLDNLVAYPVNENGLMIGKDVPFSRPHRHWSHMQMVHPLHIMDLDVPANRELIVKSLDHWLAVGNTTDGDGIKGWSRAAAASLHAALGDGDKAIESIHKHMGDTRYVRPNTMYIEGCPVIECSIILARSLQDMLLQSHNELIRVFPAVPTAWKDAVFHNLRTEGAFLVSARRQAGQTIWVNVQSLAGEPCRIRPGFSGPFNVTVNGKTILPKDVGNGMWELPLARGDKALLLADGVATAFIEAIPMAEEEANPWGYRIRNSKPSLSTGKAAQASGVCLPGYEADKAVDNDEETRWGAAIDARSGWLEVDLGKDEVIGRVEILEASFPRTEEFAIEYKVGEIWKELSRGTTIGEKKQITFPPVTARHIRLNILKANEIPTIDEFRILPPAAVR
jgi:hypothetical protein